MGGYAVQVIRASMPPETRLGKAWALRKEKKHRWAKRGLWYALRNSTDLANLDSQEHRAKAFECKQLPASYVASSEGLTEPLHRSKQVAVPSGEASKGTIFESACHLNLTQSHKYRRLRAN